MGRKRMKKGVRFILFVMAKGSTLLYPGILSLKINFLINVLFTYRHLLKMKVYSLSTIFERPFTIIGHKYISMGDYFSSRPGLRIECYNSGHTLPKLSIGDHVNLNFRCHIGVINEIFIGNNVLIGSNVLITDHSHGTTSFRDLIKSPNTRNLYSKGPVIIEDNVWIGENASILSNVRIGHHSVIGCNTVVSKNVPPYCIVYGNPMKIIQRKETD